LAPPYQGRLQVERGVLLAGVCAQSGLRRTPRANLRIGSAKRL
jgi:hypothetical protein